MKRKICFLLCVCCLITICACQKKTIDEKVTKTNKYTIQTEVKKRFSSKFNVDESIKDYKALGQDYCTDAYEENGNIVIEATDSQIENYSELLKKNMKKSVEAQLSGNDNYKFSYDEDAFLAKLYVDEKNFGAVTESITLAIICIGVSELKNISGYDDCSFEIEIYNWNNQKLVRTVTSPDNFRAWTLIEEWENSYNE